GLSFVPFFSASTYRIASVFGFQIAIVTGRHSASVVATIGPWASASFLICVSSSSLARRIARFMGNGTDAGTGVASTGIAGNRARISERFKDVEPDAG